jgi:DNA-binding IclR family transcriptional regulator
MPDEAPGQTSHAVRRVPAVTRAVAILRKLGQSPEPVGVNRLARELDLVPSTCLHILRALADEGLVSFDPATKRYAIGLGILPIARSALVQNSFARIIEPGLTRLSRTFGGTALATELARTGHMIVIALSRADQPFRLQVDLGSRFPALISATGRCHAAYNLDGLSDSELKARFARLKWDNPPTYRAWKRDVDEVRHVGYAVDRGDYINGVTILAVPVLDDRGRLTHSLVAIDISERFESMGIEALARDMLTVRDAAGRLFGPPAA